MIKFLPSYVGSKAYWIPYLEQYKDRDFVELFCGSAVLSANLAKSAILNDKDFFVFKILSKFDDLIVYNGFTISDFLLVRKYPEWWKYAYMLQKMAFSGVFRYSKNGYNVPPKKTVQKVDVLDDYKAALGRWNQLNPSVLNLDYMDVPTELLLGKVVVCDPPYENSKAAYNKVFDYHIYWEYIRLLEGIASDIIVFDSKDNLPLSNNKTRSMVVNGKYKKNEEGIFIFSDGLKAGHVGEVEFLKLFPKLTRTDGKTCDFIDSTGNRIELKSDYYDMSRTDNFFIERFSYGEKPGGPWQALEKGSNIFIYFFVKNNKFFTFDTKKLVEQLDIICKNKGLVHIGNKNYVTRGYKVPRKELEHLLIEFKGE